MATGVYNGFKGDLRDKVGQLQDLLIRDGYMPPATQCYMCYQTEGRIVYHLEDYRDVMNSETPMCFHCHMVLHCCRSAPDTYRGQARREYWEMYKDAVKAGYRKRLFNAQDLFKAIDEGRLL